MRTIVGLWLAFCATGCAGALSGPIVLDLAEFPDFSPEGMPQRFEVVRSGDLIPVFGYVLHASGYEPRASAMITVVGAGGGALSQADGRYALWVPAGRHILRVEQLGFVSDSVRIAVDSVPVRADFIMNEHSAEWPCGAPERICPDTLEGSSADGSRTSMARVASGGVAGAPSNKELLLSAKAFSGSLVTPLVCEASGCGSRIPGR